MRASGLRGICDDACWSVGSVYEGDDPPSVVAGPQGDDCSPGVVAAREREVTGVEAAGYGARKIDSAMSCLDGGECRGEMKCVMG